MFLFKNIYLAQNLIQNSSFESYSHLACGSGSFYDTSVFPVLKTIDIWEQYNSPDYFLSTCPQGGYNVPNSFFGYQSAKHGNSYVGISVYQGINSEYKEYIYQQLQNPLQAGKVYCLSFWVSRADRKEYAIKQMGAYFSNSLPTLVGGSYINANPQVVNQNGIITDTIGWTQIQGCFTAQGGEQFVIFGNFNSNANTDTLYAGTNNLIPSDPPFAYYYIDDVSLVEDNSTNISEQSSSSEVVGVYPNPAKDVLNISISNELLNERKTEIKIYNTIGELVLSESLTAQNLSIETYSLQSGVYFYRILVEGKIVKSDKVVIIR